MDRLMASMDPRVRLGLTDEQEREVRRALAASVRLPGRFPVDVRFTVNLILTRVFVVLIMGRDRRRQARRTRLERRTSRRRAGSVLGLTALFAIIILATLGLGYAIKCSMGIDLIPGAHLRDLVRW